MRLPTSVLKQDWVQEVLDTSSHPSEHALDAVAIDTETTGLNVWGTFSDRLYYPARPFAVSWCYADLSTTGYARWPVDPSQRKVLYGKGWTKGGLRRWNSLEWKGGEPDFKDNLKYWERVAELLENPRTIKIFHNAGFDCRQLIKAGFKIRGLIVDTKVMAHVATHGSRFTYSLKPMCEELFDFPVDDRADLEHDVKHKRHIAKANGWKIAEGKEFGKQPWLADFWLGDPELVKTYAIGDVQRTMLLFLFFGPELMKDPGLAETFRVETELFLGPVFSMEWNGIRIFKDDHRRLRVFYESYLDKQRVEIDKYAGPDFNPRSPKQKIEVLIHGRGLEPLKWTKPSKTYPEGNPKVDGEFLQTYAEADNPDPLCRAVLEHQNAAYAISNFVDPFEMHAVAESPGVDVLHTNIRATGAITGRMSSHDVNLMNIASEDTGRKRSEIGLKPRECLGPRPDHIWYLPDYSQIEVWIFAHLSGSKTMMDILMSGRDFHGEICRTVWGAAKDFEKRFNYYRKRGKLVMFSKLYGGGVGKQATLMDCSYAEAKEFVEQWEATLPDVATYMQRMIRKAHRQGFIQNPFGRCYDIPENLAYRAVNYMIQGTAADVLKRALNNIFYNLIVSKRWPAMRVLLSMHDEVLLEVPLRYHSKMLMREIVKEMQDAANKLELPVPLPVGMKIARSRWHKTKEIPLAS